MLRAKSVVASIKSSFLVYSLSLSLRFCVRLSVTPLPWCRRRCVSPETLKVVVVVVSLIMRKEKNASSSSKRLSETTKRDEKEERERERVSSFLSRCYSPPFDVLLSLLKSS